MAQASPNRTEVRTEPKQQTQSNAEKSAPGSVAQQPPASTTVVFKDFASI